MSGIGALLAGQKAMKPPTETRPGYAGRGSVRNPPGRFERLALDDLPPAPHEGGPEEVPTVTPTRFLADTTRDILSRNDSPDIPFTFSVNPYRGCEHGCSYCYARPTHEYLGFSAGLDFESRIVVKGDAPELLARRLAARGWQPQVVAMSGVTDCYQPVEQRLEITRRCLEVFLRFRNPVGLITKNALVLRDLDLLQALAARRLVRVSLSITTLDAALARAMEPRAVSPRRRLEAVARLAEAGVPVTVNVAPVVPGLTDHELPALLAEAACHGALAAHYLLLRLPGAVEGLFLAWLRERFPDRAGRVERAIRGVRGGALSENRFGLRHRGQGVRAEAIDQLFRLHARRLGLDRDLPPLDTSAFRVPAPGGQQELFD